MKFRTFTLPLFLISLFALTISAQQPTPTPDDDALKISTTLIQVDLTATDKKGNVVTDLKPEEFEIYQNGKKQDITNFSFISVAKPPEPAVTQSKPDKKTIPIPPVKLKTEQVRRTYALVVDDLGLSFESIRYVQLALKKFVNEMMRDGDLVAIIRTGKGMGATQSFTSDRRQLLATIDKLEWNAYGRSGISAFSPIESTLKEDLAGTKRNDGRTRSASGNQEDKEFLNQIDEFRNQNFSIGSLGALRYIIRGMQDLPGRKAVMFFSEGFQLVGGNGPTRVFDAMRLLADMANRASVVIYTLDPRGLQNPAMALADDNVRDLFTTSPGSGRFYSDPRDARNAGFLDSQQSLRFLAKETGGTAYTNQNFVDVGLEEAIADQSSYYLLGYQPDDDTFDVKKNKFNQLEIKVTRPDVKIRYRSGFFAVADEKIRSVPKTPLQRLTQALTSPFGASDINLNLYPVFQNEAQSGDMIQALVYIDAKDLQFKQEAGEKRKANFDLIAMTFGDNGLTVDQLSKNYTLEVSEKVYQNMLANGFVYTLTVPIKKTGAYQFRVALRDTATDKIGSVSQFIEVPNVKKQMVLSNLVLDNFTAAEWQKVMAGGNREESGRSVLLDTTLRQYKRGTIVRYDYVIYNPKQSQQIESQLRLIKDGKVVYEEQPVAVGTNGQPDVQRLATAGAVSLGKNLEIGNYVLQVIVTDKTSAKKFATQFVEFEIVK